MVRHFPSTEATRDKTLAAALMAWDLCVGVVVCASIYQTKKKKKKDGLR